jgi:cell wall-associated NlpC family hydrolase
MSRRADFLRIARSYIGTPYHHMGRQPGIGLDCAGVVICAAREAGLVAADFDVPAYTRSPDGRMLDFCDAHMDRLPGEREMLPGDVVVLEVDVDPQHLGVIGDHRFGGHSIVHALATADGRGRVLEQRLVFARGRRFVAAYRVRGLD